jgi:hypothetical protein
VVEQRYLPDGLERGAFFSASPRGWESEQRARLDGIRDKRSKGTRQSEESAARPCEDGD